MAIRLNNASTGAVTLKPASSGSWSFTLPLADGASGTFLGTDGAGGYSWQSVGVTGANGAVFGLDNSITNSSVNVSTITVSGGSSSMALAIKYKGSSGFFAAKTPDSTSGGGDIRGTACWDMQQGRTLANRVAAQPPSIILGGYDNGIALNSTNRMSVICGGNNNTISIGNNKNGPAVILGGKSNSISSAASAGFDVGNTSIWGGELGIVNFTRAAIMNGYKAQATTSYALVFGGDSFVNSGQSGQGQCQVQVFTGSTSTANATPTSLNNTSSPYIPLCQNREAFHFFGYCSAVTTSYSTAKFWYITGCVKRTAAGNITFVGTPTVTVLAGGAGWTIAVSLDTTNQCIETTATGAASTFIRWALHYYMVETIVV